MQWRQGALTRGFTGILAGALVLAGMPSSLTQAQTVRPDLSQVKVVAVAPIEDRVGFRTTVARLAAVRLGEMLPKDRLRIIPVDQTERAMREMGIGAQELRTLAGAADLGRRLGVDAIITGALTQADVDPGGPPPTSDDIPEGPPAAYVTLDMRVLVVATRQVVFRAEAFGYAQGFAPLTQATLKAVREFVTGFAGLL